MAEGAWQGALGGSRGGGGEFLERLEGDAWQETMGVFLLQILYLLPQIHPNLIPTNFQPISNLQDTCAADGMCQEKCPVKINTGELIKHIRSEEMKTATRSSAAAR